jgi:hypothetical protein
MKSAVRVFALLVAFAGLASASFSSANTQKLPAQMTTAVIGPSPDIPMPLPCQASGKCVEAR